MIQPARALKARLALLSFMQFAVWGSYLSSLGNFLNAAGLGTHIGWFYAVQAVMALFMPALMGLLADRRLAAQRVMALCHAVCTVFMGLAGLYALRAGSAPSFRPLFMLYAVAVAFFMPTVGLCNTIAFSALRRAGLDTFAHFPAIRVFGTVGFICAMLTVNFAGFQADARQLVLASALSALTALYALTMPECRVFRSPGLGLRSWLLRGGMPLFLGFCVLVGAGLQISNSYANPYISSFSRIPQYAHTWVAANANALISLSQISEAVCILLIPAAVRRFGIKATILTAIAAWVLRFGLFALGDTGPGVWMFVLSCVVYGVAFDFFNIAGSMYVDRLLPDRLRARGQGVFMSFSAGIGGTAGILCAQAVVNRLVFTQPAPGLRLEGWQMSWLVFAAYMLVVAVMFGLLFRDRTPRRLTPDR